MKLWYVVAVGTLGTLSWLTPVVAADPTFNKDVAPILWKHCAGCHRTGEVGPFPLLTYKEASKRADFLVQVTKSKQMPPWKAEPGYGKFAHERKLTEAELAILEAWAKAGAPEGDAKDLPQVPNFPEGWQIGKPDLILEMKEAFTIPASGRDIQQCFVIPIPIDEDKTVAAVEFRPGNRSVVHHAIMYLDSSGIARRKDEADKEYGYRAFGGPGFFPTGGLGAWAPGTGAEQLPEGVGKYIRKGSDLVLQIHYHPTGKEEKDRSQVGVYFTKKPAEKIVGGIGLAYTALNIKPGDKNYRVSTTTEPLPCDVQALSAFPHMHLIGKEIKAWAETPEGKEIPLIWIKDWDFNWQGSYYFAEPVKIPKNSRVKFEAVFDNSSENFRNPSSPPKTVRWGEQTYDEMALFGIQVITDTMDDMRKVMRMRGAALGQLLGSSPPPNVKKKGESDIPKEGFIIPETIKAIASQYDKNQDGRLSEEELDNVPDFARDRVIDFLKRNQPQPKP